MPSDVRPSEAVNVVLPTSTKMDGPTGIGLALSVGSWVYSIVMNHGVPNKQTELLERLADNQNKMLGYLQSILAEVQWSQQVTAVIKPVTDINYFFHAMRALKPGDTEAASNWADSVLREDSLGIAYALYSINQAMMGKGLTTASLPQIFANRINSQVTPQSKFREALWFFRSLADLQTKGFSCLSNAFNLKHGIGTINDRRTKEFLSPYDFTLSDQEKYNHKAIYDVSSWYENPAWGDNYFTITDDISYVDTNDVIAPVGCVVVGAALYRKGNRIAIKIKVAEPQPNHAVSQRSARWYENTAWGNNYFTLDEGNNYVDARRVDPSQVNLPDGNYAIVGLRLFQLGNRIAIGVLFCTVDYVTPKIEKNPNWSQINDFNPTSYFDIRPDNCYVNTNTVEPTPYYYTSGAQLYLFGNRIAIQLDTR
jgi:hypothetical protein